MSPEKDPNDNCDGVSYPQEQGESQENLKLLVDEICSAVTKLPPHMEVTAGAIIRTVMVSKAKNAPSKLYFAHIYTVKITGENVTVPLLEITYQELHDATCNGGPNGDRLHPVERKLQVSSPQGKVLETDKDGIKIPPKVKAEDIELLAAFLAKAVAQHEMNELKKAQAIEAGQLETAKVIRQVLRSL